VLLASVVVAWGLAAAVRNLVWRDDHALFLDMVAKVPGSAKAHYNLAYDAGRRGDREEQGRHLETAVALFPRYYDAWATLGGMAWADKRWDDAVALYRKSVEVHPAYENGLWGLARVLAEAGRTEEASKAWNQAVAKDPDSYPIAYHHAAFLQSQGRFDDAEREWRRAIELVDEPADARLGLARTLAARGKPGDLEAARKEARRALAADPGHVEARRFLNELRRREIASRQAG
jgi:tetratricopeptide (TPR) repeat protein